MYSQSRRTVLQRSRRIRALYRKLFADVKRQVGANAMKLDDLLRRVQILKFVMRACGCSHSCTSQIPAPMSISTPEAVLRAQAPEPFDLLFSELLDVMNGSGSSGSGGSNSRGSGDSDSKFLPALRQPQRQSQKRLVSLHLLKIVKGYPIDQRGTRQEATVVHPTHDHLADCILQVSKRKV